MTYEEAHQELQQLLAAVKGGQMSLSELRDKVVRAHELIEMCRSKLRETKDEIDQLLPHK